MNQKLVRMKLQNEKLYWPFQIEFYQKKNLTNDMKLSVK